MTLSNRPDWKTLYNGVDLNFQKRLTNKWMVRGSVTWQDWKQKGGLDSCYDPTSNRGGNALVWPGTAIPVATGSTCALDDIAAAPAGAYGSKTEVFLNSRWQFNVGGLYQLPVGFAVAANVYGREGYPYLQYVRFDPGDGLGTRDNIIGALGDHRYKDVFDTDLRIEKVIQVSPLQITLSADFFNLLNSGTVLQRNARTPATATATDGTVTPSTRRRTTTSSSSRARVWSGSEPASRSRSLPSGFWAGPRARPFFWEATPAFLGTCRNPGADSP